jgi:HTH-type transcriptional regulator/antitoxin HigA
MIKTRRNKILRKQKRKVAAASQRGKTKPRAPRLLSEEAYNLTMDEIDQLMKVGEENLSEQQIKRLKSLSEAAEYYEDFHHPLPTFSTIQDLIKLRIVQMGINQTYAAVLLGVSSAKFSLIMKGKQKPDVYFIKALHEKLEIDADLLLKTI